MCPAWELNQQPFGLQVGAQSTEPDQPGPKEGNVGDNKPLIQTNFMKLYDTDKFNEVGSLCSQGSRKL